MNVLTRQWLRKRKRDKTEPSLQQDNVSARKKGIAEGIKQRWKCIAPSWLVEFTTLTLLCCAAENNCIISVALRRYVLHPWKWLRNIINPSSSTSRDSLAPDSSMPCWTTHQCVLHCTLVTNSFSMGRYRSKSSTLRTNWRDRWWLAIGFQKCSRNSKHLLRFFFPSHCHSHFSLRIVTSCSLSPLHSCASVTCSIEPSRASVSLAASSILSRTDDTSVGSSVFGGFILHCAVIEEPLFISLQCKPLLHRAETLRPTSFRTHTHLTRRTDLAGRPWGSRCWRRFGCRRTLLRLSLPLVFSFSPLQGFFLQHPSMLLNTIPPIGSSDFHGVQSFALVHHHETVPVINMLTIPSPSISMFVTLRTCFWSTFAFASWPPPPPLTAVTGIVTRLAAVPALVHVVLAFAALSFAGRAFLAFPLDFPLLTASTSIGSSFFVVYLLSLIVIDCFVLL